MDIADGELVQVRCETAAWFDFTPGIDNERLAWPFAIILGKPLPIPRAGQALRPLHRGEVVPIQDHRQVQGDQEITSQHLGPLNHALQRLGQGANRLKSLSGVPARVGQ